jgi:putative tricarboxylic transport membrane protein
MKDVKSGQERIAAAVLWIFSVVYLCAGSQLKFGVLKKPGAGFIPMAIGVLLFLSASAYLYRALAGKSNAPLSEGEGAQPWKLDWLPVLGITGCLIAYPFLLGRLHFIVATAGCTFVMLLSLRFRKHIRALLVAALIGVASYLLFSFVLGVVLPNGPLEASLSALFRR